MSILASFLWDRFQSGALPIAMVSTDNFSQNGLRFQTAMVTIAKEWQKLGHSNITMTLDNYIHLSKEKEKEAVFYCEKALKNL